MKRFLALLLLLLPTLVACVNQEPEQSQSTTLPVVTLPPAYYEENSSIEEFTDGVVKQYNLPDNGYRGICRVGNGILLISDSEQAQLRMLTGESCIPSASLQLDSSCLEQYVSLSNGFAYHDPTTNTVLYLDSNLSPRHTVSLTSEMRTPILSPDGSLIFYCVGSEIRALDVSKNISRLIKTQNVPNQALVGTCFKGSVLICRIEDEYGHADTQYISAKDGKTLSTENTVAKLFTDDADFLALWSDGSVKQWVCGTRGFTAMRFAVDTMSNIYDAMELGGIVGYESVDDSLILSFYSIPDAMRTAKITLENIDPPDLVLADKQSGCILMVTNAQGGNGKVLLKWDLSRCATEDSSVYTERLYTAENPNLEQLEALQRRVEDLNTKHGTKIRIWQDAVATPGSYDLIPEHQPEAIEGMLDQLEAVLNEFPKKFVYKSISSRVRICLVRSIDGQTTGQQYWDGRYAYIALCSGSDIRQEFLKGFGIVIDSHVLGNSPIYDYWDTLNPVGFRYGKSDESYINGADRYFVDLESMSSGMIDRSHVFWQAMLPDNAEMFSNENMQKKLTMLCKAIRDAWRLEKKTDIYPWEQYLEKPIAAKK